MTVRVLHVSDLHLGRDFSGVSRRAEQEELVAELCGMARDESVDVAVVAGDVFDTATPPAWAEELFFVLVDGLSDGGRRAVVVVAGNHDSPVRLGAGGLLARRQGIVLVTRPDQVPHAVEAVGGVRIEPLAAGAFVVHTAAGARVGVAALPFVSEPELVRRTNTTTLPRASEDRDAYGRALAQLLAARFDQLPDDAPRLVVAHQWVGGGLGSDSERLVRAAGLADLPAHALPPADYVALGHLHRPQQVEGAPCPAVYAGSPLAYSLSEAGQQKRAVLVTLEAGAPAELRDLPIRAGRPVEEWRAQSLDEVRARVEALAGPLPIVRLHLDLGRAPSRSELEELHALGPAFVAVETRGGAHDPDADPFGTELPADDDGLVRAFVAHAFGTSDPELESALLGLLADAARPAPEEAGTREAA